METSGDGCCTSAHRPPVAMETGSKGNNREAVALMCVCVYVCAKLEFIRDYLDYMYVCVLFLMMPWELWKKLIWIHKCVCVCVRVPMCMLTFVVGGVVDAEISVPDDSQLHGKTAHLHPIIEILSPWQPKRGRGRDREEHMCVCERERARERERSCWATLNCLLSLSPKGSGITILFWMQNASSTGGSEYTHKLTNARYAHQWAFKDEIIFHLVL